MSNKRLIPMLALLVLVSGIVIASVAAGQSQEVRVPPGAIVDSPNAGVGDSGPRPGIPAAPALPAPSGTVAFSDDFSGSSLDKWSSLSTAPGTWAAADGRLQQRGTNGDLTADEAAVLTVKDVTLSNGIFSSYVYPTSGAPVGFVFRGSDAGYYRLTLFAQGPNDKAKASLEKVGPTGTVEIAQTPVATWPGYTQTKWQLVTINTDNDTIVVSVDGIEILRATDSAYHSGWVGVWTFADMGAQFDNVRIQQTAGR